MKTTASENNKSTEVLMTVKISAIITSINTLGEFTVRLFTV